MQSIDMEYFSEYKTVERICRDMYGKDGVKAYIEEMETNNSREKMFISNWENKLRTLKHLKWLRNQIAHDNEVYEVTKQDLSDIKLFHDELLAQQDPLALLYKEIEKTKKKQQEYRLQQENLQEKHNQNNNEPLKNDETSSLLPLFLLFGGALVAIAIITFFLFTK